MKKWLFSILFLFILTPMVYAGQIEERHYFFNLYNPTSTISYGNGVDATGDQVAVNTYSDKTIQINGVSVNEDVLINIQGRLANNPYWSTLDTVEFGKASADSSINQVISVTEDVDFLRVSVQNTGTDGNSQIDVEGKFTNIER